MSKYVRQEKSQRKHPIISSSTSIIKAPVVPSAPKERPGWKGPGFTKKTAKPPPRPAPASAAPTGPNIQQSLLPLELQQLLLNIFRTTFPICQDYDALKPTLREIKNALSEGDIERAFGRLDWMEAYVARWSPSRALCYVAVLLDLCEEFREEPWIKSLLGGEGSSADGSSTSPGPRAYSLSAVCFGGGAAEVMSFGAILRYILSNSGTKHSASVSESSSSLSGLEPSLPPPRVELHLLNPPNWTPIISSLQFGLTTPPTLSKYASASAKASNAPFLFPDILKTSFHQKSILETSQDELSSIIGREPALITLFFTLDELLASSVTKCTALLLKLTLAAPRNSLLLITDSPDSSAGITLEKDAQGKERKRYPMHYLLDMVLLEKELPNSVDKKPAWEKLIEDQSRLFRVAEQLKYPIGLENIKFQVHLFRKL